MDHHRREKDDRGVQIEHGGDQRGQGEEESEQDDGATARMGGEPRAGGDEQSVAVGHPADQEQPGDQRERWPDLQDGLRCRDGTANREHHTRSGDDRRRQQACDMASTCRNRGICWVGARRAGIQAQMLPNLHELGAASRLADGYITKSWQILTTT